MTGGQDPREPDPALRRLSPGLLRGSGRDGRRRALPRPRAARPERASGAPPRGRSPLRALRGYEPDQRPEPGAPPGHPGGVGPPLLEPPALLGQPELASIPFGGAPGDGEGRRPAGSRVRDLGIQLLLG